MLEATELLTALSDSADPLKDAEGVVLRSRRLDAIEAFNAAWKNPADKKLFNTLRAAFKQLVKALRDNHLYPNWALLEREGQKKLALLPSRSSLHHDFNQLKHFCVVNKHGVGEVPLLYTLFLILYNLCLRKTMPSTALIKGIGDVILLRPPVDHVDNTSPFNTELVARYYAVRLLCGIKQLGCLDEIPVSKVTIDERIKIANLFSGKRRAAAGAYVPESLRRAFEVTDAALALEAYAIAASENAAPRDARSPAKLFDQLVQQLKQFKGSEIRNAPQNARLLKLGVSALIRVMSYVKFSLGQQMYTFLRSDRYIAIVRHSQMFKALPEGLERLRFLNFLYANGRLKPRYFIKRFQPHFGDNRLIFLDEETGFELASPPARSQ